MAVAADIGVGREPFVSVSDVGEVPERRQVSFDTHPDCYRHWTLRIEGEVAWLVLDVDEGGGLVPGYELKLNSYDLGVDIELYDATQRLRFEHPEVKAVVITSGKERVFCAGANIRMLASSPHEWKVNFCKFTNETRNGIEDAAAYSGQRYLAAVNGSCAGGGYELALACDHILLIDDNVSAVSLPEVPLLGVLPGTGGLTRLVDKRRVRKDRADVFATRPDGLRGKAASGGVWWTNLRRHASSSMPSSDVPRPWLPPRGGRQWRVCSSHRSGAPQATTRSPMTSSPRSLTGPMVQSTSPFMRPQSRRPPTWMPRRGKELRSGHWR